VAEPLSGGTGGQETPAFKKRVLPGLGFESQLPLRTDKSVQRAMLYFFIFVVLLIGAFGPVPPPRVTNPSVHDVLETLATGLSFVVGSLALVRFYTKKEGAFLFIGTGFLGSGFLNVFHVLVSTGLVGSWTPLETRDLSAWSFTASGAYLALFLFVSWISWRREFQGKGPDNPGEVPVYLTAGALAILTLTVFSLVPVTAASFPGSPIPQPGEFFPTLLLLLAFSGYLTKGKWRYDSFEHWLAISLVIGMMAHGAFMPFAAEFHDADFYVAHILKVLGHTCVLIGLMASVYSTYRREEEAGELAFAANTALAREIDVRRTAERVLQESEERLQDFLDNAHDLIQSVSRRGEFVYVNSAWLKVLGYSEDELKGLTLQDVLHPSCLDRCAAEFQEVLQGRSLPSVELDFLAADGRVVRCAGSTNARVKDGEVVAIRSILRDMTAELEARREIEGFQANLRALVENTGDAIWSVDRSLRLITFNTAFSMALEARTGREPRVHDAVDIVFPPEDAPWYEEMYSKGLKGVAFSELRDEEIGGQMRSYELFFNPIRDSLGITGVAVFGKDVTARRRTQIALRMAKEEAERTNRAKSQFLANMSHELRTPLNSVIGFTNILLKNRGGHLDNQELGFLERISANGLHLLHLINQTLDLAKIEAGRMDLELQPIDLRSLLSETLSQMEGQVRDKPVSLELVMPEDLAPLETDGGMLKQIVINLLGNAIKFTERGKVAVQVVPEEDGREVRAIVVRDTGVGIPPDRLQAIFEAFLQADGTTRRRFGGTGLGLTISRSLCELLGYDLTVESEQDMGSAFTVHLSAKRSRGTQFDRALISEALRPMESSRPMGQSPDPGSGAPGESSGSAHR
jgi:PAS domain S-box-containing protein